MTARALTFARAYLARWWHCQQLAHTTYTMRYRHRIVELGCSCGQIFWRVQR